jgi:hypothetical protein
MPRVTKQSSQVTKPKWPTILIVCTLIAIIFTWLTVALYQRSPMIGSEQWLRLCLLLMFPLSGLYLIWHIARDAYTKFDEEGVHRPTIKGFVTCPWGTLLRIRGKGHVPRFEFESHSFSVNLLLFSDAQTIVNLITTKTPATKIVGG